MSDFDNLRVRKISTSKRLRVRIIRVSQTFGESCSNARSKQQVISSSVYKLVSGGLEISILLIIRFEFKGKEFASGLTNFVLVEKMLLAKLCKCTKKLTSSPGLILGKKS